MASPSDASVLDPGARARRARADARRRMGVSVERIVSLDEMPSSIPDSVAARFALTTSLTRAAFGLSGRSYAALPRAAWPGEIFSIDDDGERRPA